MAWGCETVRRYVLTVYALGETLTPDEGFRLVDLMVKALAEAMITGTYAHG